MALSLQSAIHRHGAVFKNINMFYVRLFNMYLLFLYLLLNTYLYTSVFTFNTSLTNTGNPLKSDKDFSGFSFFASTNILLANKTFYSMATLHVSTTVKVRLICLRIRSSFETIEIRM